MAKPSTTATLNTSHALAANLAAAWLLNDASGTTVKDYAGSTTLTLGGGATWSANGLTMAAASARAAALTPSALKLTLPITLYLRMIPTATSPSQSATYLSVWHNNTNTSPFLSIAISAGTSPLNYRLDTNRGGTFTNANSSYSIASDEDVSVDIAIVMTAAGSVMYHNGTSIASTSGGDGPTYSSTSTVGFGDVIALSRNPQCEAVFGYIWHADMSSQLATIQADPYAMFNASASGLLLARRRFMFRS